MKRIAPTLLLCLTLLFLIPACSEGGTEKYKDEASGLTFKYPAGWMVEQIALSPTNKVMVASVLLTSWTHAPGEGGNRPAEGTSVSFLLLDSTSSFEDFVDHSRAFIQAGNGLIESEEALRLRGGFDAVEWTYTVKGETRPGYYLTVEYGDLFLRVVASGDMAVIRGIVETIR